MVLHLFIKFKSFVLIMNLFTFDDMFSITIEHLSNERASHFDNENVQFVQPHFDTFDSYSSVLTPRLQN